MYRKDPYTVTSSESIKANRQEQKWKAEKLQNLQIELLEIQLKRKKELNYEKNKTGRTVPCGTDNE